jgi:hypothetical protein
MSDHSPCVRINHIWTVDGSGEAVAVDCEPLAIFSAEEGFMTVSESLIEQVKSERGEHPEEEEEILNDEYPTLDPDIFLRGSIIFAEKTLRELFPEIGDAKLDVENLLGAFKGGKDPDIENFDFFAGVLYGILKKSFPGAIDDQWFLWLRTEFKGFIFGRKVKELAERNDGSVLDVLGKDFAAELFELHRAGHLLREAEKQSRAAAAEGDNEPPVADRANVVYDHVGEDTYGQLREGGLFGEEGYHVSRVQRNAVREAGSERLSRTDIENIATIAVEQYIQKKKALKKNRRSLWSW